MSKSKILVLDIETKPTTAYVWRMWDENISQEQILEDGGIICFGAKWVGSNEMLFYSDWQHGHRAMLEAAHALLSEADAVVTYNGDKFDLPKLMGEFLIAGLTPPPPPTSIDLLKAVKKLGYSMNRLAYIAPLLKVGSKIKHEGFSLWARVLAGNPIAERKMERYCSQDVRVTERLYKRILPFIRNHPHLGTTKAAACGACSSPKTQSRGWRRTKSFRIQRIQCQSCGSWFDGKREKVT